ncbi:MAG: hypothetical protein LBT38_01465 [Deltaproteobacteria bacterium]|nr:hypothetical protein [Deltaproteobacteria bacterium]
MTILNQDPAFAAERAKNFWPTSRVFSARLDGSPKFPVAAQNETAWAKKFNREPTLARKSACR